MTGELESLKRLDRFANSLGFLAFLTLIAHFGFPEFRFPMPFLMLWTAVLPTGLFLESLFRLLVVRDPWRYLRNNPIRYSILLMILLELSGIATWSSGLGETGLTFVVGQIYLAISLFANFGSWIQGTILANRWLANRRIPVLALPAISFVFTIIAGAFLLWMPGMRVVETSFIDNLFTSTSAVCVTGLTSYDVGTVLTPIGQAVLAALIQIGGLGTLAIIGMLTFWYSGKLSIGERAAFSELLGGKQMKDTRRVVATVMKVAIGVELGGAVLLWLSWRGKIEHAALQSLFHSISAFCNAGFSLNSDNLAGFSADPLPLIVIMFLITAGGLGFMAIENIGGAIVSRLVPWLRPVPLSRTTRMALRISLLLFAVGTLAFLLDGRLSDRPRGLMAAAFQSVTVRTAGFQIESQLNFGRVGLIATIVLMIVGASPQSTGGGVKTTLVARLFLRVDSKEREARRKRLVFLQSFRIAFFLIAAYVAFGAAAGAGIALIDGASFSDSLFESFSALGTVGLSRDLTPNLSSVSKIVVIILMFTGRVLFPTLVVGIVRSRRPEEGDVDWA